MPIFSKEPITFDKAARWFFGILLIVSIFFALHYLRSVLIPFAIALVVAYLLNPGVMWIKKVLKLKSRLLAVIIGLTFLVAIITGLIMAVTPLVSAEFHEMHDILVKYANEEIEEAPEWFNEVKEYVQSISQNAQLQELFSQEEISKIAMTLGEQASTLFDSSASIISGIMGLVLGILYFMFAMVEYDGIFYSWQGLVPARHRAPVRLLMNNFRKAMSSYFRAQSVVALCVGILFAIGFSIIGLPMAVVFGLFIGLLNMVPYLQLAAILPAMFLAIVHAIESQTHIGLEIGMVLSVFVVVQIIQDVILVPKIMGNRTGLNAVVILLGLGIWGKLLGFMGLVVAIPLTVLALSYYKAFIKKSDDKEEAYIHLQEGDGE